MEFFFFVLWIDGRIILRRMRKKQSVQGLQKVNLALEREPAADSMKY
jgi:hypothetical protein